MPILFETMEEEEKKWMKIENLAENLASELKKEFKKKDQSIPIFIFEKQDCLYCQCGRSDWVAIVIWKKFKNINPVYRRVIIGKFLKDEKIIFNKKELEITKCEGYISEKERESIKKKECRR